MPGEIYSTGAVVGKTLLAEVDVPIYNNLPDRGGKQMGTIKAGNPVGIVYSWVIAADGGVWWQFKDARNKVYYSLQGTGIYSLSALREQGVLSTQEAIEAAKKKEDAAYAPWYENLLNSFGGGTGIFTKVLLIGGGAFVLVQLIKSRK